MLVYQLHVPFQTGVTILYHCVGSSPASVLDTHLLARIVHFLTSKEEGRHYKDLKDSHYSAIYQQFKEVLKEARQDNLRKVIIIDAVNEVSGHSLFSGMGVII